MLIGQLRPSSGSITVAGLDCFTERAEVMSIAGYVPDEPFFHDYLTGRELIRYVSSLHGLDMAEAGPRAEELIKRLALDEALEEYAVNYSKGMKKKLAVVLSLLHQPRLLVMDEPTNGLDPHSTRVLHEVMLDLRRQGVTVIFSTHLLEQVERLASMVAILVKGRIAASGTIEELRARRADASLEDLFFSVTASASPERSEGAGEQTGGREGREPTA